MASYNAFRLVREEVLKLLSNMEDVDQLLKEHPLKRLDIDHWEDLRVAEVFLRMMPSLFSYMKKVDQSQLESLLRLHYLLSLITDRVARTLVERSDHPDVKLHDRLDKFATNREVE